MNNKIHAIDSSKTPTPARAIGGPATCGIEFDKNSTQAVNGALVFQPSNQGKPGTRLFVLPLPQALLAIAGIPADVSVNASGTVQNTLYTLNTIAIPANTLSANGKGIEFEFAGTVAANANAKDFLLAFGSASISLVTGTVTNNVPYKVYGTIYRTGVGAQIVTAELQIGGAVVGQVVQTTAADETAAWSLILQSRNTAAAAASATGKFANASLQN